MKLTLSIVSGDEIAHYHLTTTILHIIPFKTSNLYIQECNNNHVNK